MSPPHPIAQRCLVHVVIVMWLITWILTVPLFHVHLPDTTDGWSSLQSGGPHTVFTPALPGEFSHPFHDRFGHLSQRAVNSPEFPFTLLSDTDEDQKGKELLLLSAYGDPRDALVSSWPFESYGTYRGPPQSHAFPAFRAPPRVICA
jgi:hypothetical protein